MKKLLALFLLVSSQLTAQQNIIFKNANVIPIHTNTVLKGYDVTIENGIIVRIDKTKKTRTKANVEVVDATGQYLMPGLSDMHVHIPRQNKFGYGADEFLALQLVAGVTTLRSMRGAEADLVLQKQLQNNEKIGPRLYTSAPPFYASRVWVNTDSLTKLIKRYKQQGYQCLKVLSVPSVAWFDTLAQVARGEGLILTGHNPNGVSIEHALNKGMKSIEHLGGYEALSVGSTALDNAIDKTISYNTYNCPTLDWYFVNYTQVPYADLKKRTGLDRLPTALVKEWTKVFDDYFAKQATQQPDSLRKEQVAEAKYVQKKLDILLSLHKKGAKLLTSPDASTVFQVPGLSVIEEMKWFQKAGIANYDILKAATYNAADYVGEANQWGSIQKGYKANMILLQNNPLESLDNLRSIKGVMLGNKWYSEGKLSEILQAIKQKYHE